MVVDSLMMATYRQKTLSLMDFHLSVLFVLSVLSVLSVLFVVFTGDSPDSLKHGKTVLSDTNNVLGNFESWKMTTYNTE